MNSEPAQIVVLTPVRNEAWILDAFLTLTSRFADCIVVADQRSTDASRAICARHAKVKLVENPSEKYDEADRQRLLLRAARELVPGPRVLIALDADEIASADSLAAPEWEAIRRLPPGTALYLSKPDLLPDPLRYETGTALFPLGLVDDGREHQGQLIHSTRLPLVPGDPRYDAETIRFFHLACLRHHEYRARQAYYCMVESLNQTTSWRVRNLRYEPAAFQSRYAVPSQPLPAAWTEGYRALGFDLGRIVSKRFNDFHVRALQLFAQHGAARFAREQVWWEDWSAAARALQGDDARPIARPSAWRRGSSAVALTFFRTVSKAKRALLRRA